MGVDAAAPTPAAAAGVDVCCGLAHKFCLNGETEFQPARPVAVSNKRGVDLVVVWTRHGRGPRRPLSFLAAANHCPNERGESAGVSFVAFRVDGVPDGGVDLDVVVVVG